MKATWAVACLLSAVILAAGGCATKKVADTPKASGGDAAAPRVKRVPTAVPAQGSSGTIREENVAMAPDAPVPPKEAGRSSATENTTTSPVEKLPVEYSGTSYRLGPEDAIRVSVWENRELTLDLVVRPDGKISMPLIQDVMAEGLTAVELGSRIQEKLATFIKEPQVSVIVLQVNAPKYYVIGSVAKPGTYPLRGETSVLQALSMAGGFTQFASPRSIKLIRNNGGKQEVRKVNYYNLLDEAGEGNYLLRSGDTIAVP